MSTVQRIFRALLPAGWFAAMERESSEWRIRCTECEADRGTVWEAGGIRWKAAGNPRIARRCVACGGCWARLVREPNP